MLTASSLVISCLLFNIVTIKSDIENQQKGVADVEKASAFQAEIFEGRHLRNSDFDANWHKYVESITAKNDFYATQNTHSYNENISA